MKSFSQKLKAGWSKAELMKYYVMDEKQYNKVLVCLQEIVKMVEYNDKGRI
ncbi:MAG: hypothetical protein Q7J35_11200 [Candidatus Methanoperedens sp.]|nr:hypothetical protein [Candidatus Methanoperedens sp.]